MVATVDVEPLANLLKNSLAATVVKKNIDWKAAVVCPPFNKGESCEFAKVDTLP